MFAKTKSLDEIVDRAYELLLTSIGARLVAPHTSEEFLKLVEQSGRAARSTGLGRPLVGGAMSDALSLCKRY
jgi:uncharacterized protein Yka (UPF0111/DUF47 family)